jgi:hypothetical protein
MDLYKLKIKNEDIVEAVFCGTQLEKLIQHNINWLLRTNKKNFYIEIIEGNINYQNIGDTDIHRIKREGEKDSRPEKIKLSSLLNNKTGAELQRSCNLYTQLLQEKSKKINEFSKININQLLTGDIYNPYFVEHCEFHLSKLIGSIGFNSRHPQYTINVGFHFLEESHDAQFLQYFSSIGWTLNEEIKKELLAIKQKYSPLDNNVEFVLKLIIIISLHHTEEKYTENSIVHFYQKPEIQLLGQSMPEILDLYFDNESEKNKWLEVSNSLVNLFADDPFENILRQLLLMNRWRQHSSYGHYPELLTKGAQIVTNEYKIKPHTGSTKSSDIDTWNFIVVTTIEDFFLTNARLRELKSDQVQLKVFMVAIPVFFEGRALGDFFITGTYKNDHLNKINNIIDNVIKPVLPFLQKEFEHLLMQIFSIKLLIRSISLPEEQEPESPAILNGTEDEKTFWQTRMQTYDPIKALVMEKERGITLEKVFHNLRSDILYIENEINAIENEIPEGDPLKPRIKRIKSYTNRLNERVPGMYTVLKKIREEKGYECVNKNIKDLFLNRFPPCIIDVIYDGRRVDTPTRDYLDTIFKNNEYYQWVSAIPNITIRIEKSIEIGLTEILKNALRFCGNQPLTIEAKITDSDSILEIKITNNQPINKNISAFINQYNLTNLVKSIGNKPKLPMTGLGVINAIYAFHVCKVDYKIIPSNGSTIQQLLLNLKECQSESPSI